MNTPMADLSVTRPLGQAWDRMKVVLFRPFEAGRWLAIGFCAFLAMLGQGGGGGGGMHWNNRIGQHEFEQARDYVQANLHWLLPLVAGLLVLGAVIWLVLLWLSSRGQFMFLHCVANNRAEVRAPWHQFRQHGHSLFLFRLAVGLIGFVAVLPGVALAGLSVARIVGQHQMSLGWGVLAVGGLTMAVIAGVCLGLISKLTRDFVVPLMALRGQGSVAAWREMAGLFAGHKADLLLYVLVQIALAVAVGAIVLALALVTCCCGALLLAVPYVGTVLLLPVLVFDRAYTLIYLAQFGPGYSLITPAGPGVSQNAKAANQG